MVSPRDMVPCLNGEIVLFSHKIKSFCQINLNLNLTLSFFIKKKKCLSGSAFFRIGHGTESYFQIHFSKFLSLGGSRSTINFKSTESDHIFKTLVLPVRLVVLERSRIHDLVDDPDSRIHHPVQAAQVPDGNTQRF